MKLSDEQIMTTILDSGVLTQEEIQTWNERLATLIEKKENLSVEREKIQSDIEVTKLKDRVLKL